VTTLEDLASRNGTWLGDKRVEGTVPLSTGDLIRVGKTTLLVALVVTERDTRDDGARPALLTGETGSGKEVAARAIHRRSARAAGPSLAINCAALQETLIESELFGHERGAFTGAVSGRLGAFESARNGTLFLDEVGELSPTSQAKLLRALQERVITRLGSSATIPVDVRVVAATHRDLLADVATGRFRSDLYYRLDGATVTVPPLRERVRDIPALVDRTLEEEGSGARLGPGVLPVLMSYRWPGNVRELRHAVERAAALCEGGTITPADLPPVVRGESADRPSALPPSPLREHIDATERGALVAALEAAAWNQSQAARDLGITRRALIYRMERHGLKPRPGDG